MEEVVALFMLKLWPASIIFIFGDWNESPTHNKISDNKISKTLSFILSIVTFEDFFFQQKKYFFPLKSSWYFSPNLDLKGYDILTNIFNLQIYSIRVKLLESSGSRETLNWNNYLPGRLSEDREPLRLTFLTQLTTFSSPSKIHQWASVSVVKHFFY